MRIMITVGALLFASSAFAQDCEADARAAMLDVAHPTPMRQDVTTEMAGQKIVSVAISTPDRKGMALDDNDNPVSLWADGKFWTSSDAGKTWNLMSEQSPEELADQDQLREKQAQSATDFECAYGIELEGKQLNRLQLSYKMVASDDSVTSTYWVDAETGFPWQVAHEFGGAAPSVITQKNTPLEDVEIPDPDG